MIGLFKYIKESIFDVDDNIVAIEKIKDDPKAMLSRNCENFEEVVEVFSKWFGCKHPKIKKSSKLLKTSSRNSGIRLSNDKIVEFDLITKDHKRGKVITLALWGDKLLFHKRCWYLQNRWGKQPVRKYDDFIDLIGQWDRDSYKWGTNLWEWLDSHIKRHNLYSYAINKSDYVCESIFDDEEEQLDRVEGAVMIDQIKKTDSMFRREYQCYDNNQRFARTLDDVTFENGVLSIPSKNICHISVNGDTHPLSFYIAGTKELVCCNYKDETRGDLSPKTLCDKVTCGYFYSYITNKVKDIHIVIDPVYIKQKLGAILTNRPDVIFSGFDRPVLDGVTIDFKGTIPGGDIGKHIGFHEFPTFKNTKSNVTYISVYNPSAFDENDLDKLFPIFEWPHKAIIKDIQKGQDVEITIKGLKKAKAIANNPKRYHPITPIFKLKKGAKLSDIIDTSGFKDLLRFAYRDNNVNLIFSKTPIKSMLLCEPEPLKTETHQMTNDGYYVCLECDK